MSDASSTNTRAVSSHTVGASGELSPCQEQIRERVLAYYEVATEDFRVWSKGFNMHFGFWRKGMNPFRREAMLQEMNVQTLARLNLPAGRTARLADLGGETRATARTAVAIYPNLAVDVVTIAPRQVEIGKRLNGKSPRGDAITMHCVDFGATKLPGEAYDAVSVIESACHAEGATKPSICGKPIDC